MWSLSPRQQPPGTVQLYLDDDGGEQEGFPGRVSVYASFILSEDSNGVLSLEIKVVVRNLSIVQAIVNPTNHTFWNLSAFELDLSSHKLHIPGQRSRLLVDKDQVCTGEEIATARDPVFSFANQRALDNIDAFVDDIDFGGLDHFFLVDGKGGSNALAMLACLSVGKEHGKRLEMQIWSDRPGMQVYTGNFLDSTVPMKQRNGFFYPRRCAIAIEASMPPNAVNIPRFRDSVILDPGKEASAQFVYKFFVS